ncbi:hypothetical protein M9H77_29587 [Catharanthus roseus]|uniref:Uncharacterized protein n=1 Tax=Catharanthus roseus TaxID=4058 RepID=A0ACB9ZWP7_CATRO|nr:hypothetical protein M9H77_29587 [Catharanthus roseus]
MEVSLLQIQFTFPTKLELFRFREDQASKSVFPNEEERQALISSWIASFSNLTVRSTTETETSTMAPGGRGLKGGLKRGKTSNGGSNTTFMPSNGSLEASLPSQLEDISHLDTSVECIKSKLKCWEENHSRLSFQKATGDHFNMGLYLLLELELLSNTMLHSSSYRCWRNKLLEVYKKLVDAGKVPRTHCLYNFIKQDSWESVFDRIESPKFKSLGGCILLHYFH